MSVSVGFPRSFGFVCRSCRSKQTQISTRLISTTPLKQHASRTTFRTSETRSTAPRKRQAHSISASLPSSTKTRPSKLPAASKPRKAPVTNPAQTLSSLRQEVSRITTANMVPEESTVGNLLDQMHTLSETIVYGHDEQAIKEYTQHPSKSDTAVLDDLEEPTTTRQQQTISAISSSQTLSLPFRNKAADTLSDLAFTLVSHPHVFITPLILEIYTHIQTFLGRPQYLPQIFWLYANKPNPIPNSSPVQYRNARPNSPKNAVPLGLANAALDCAIHNKDLPLAITIIDLTVSTRAYRVSKLVRKATIPLLAVSATPIIAYAGATWLSTYQNVWDPSMSKMTAMAGALAYIGTLSTIGFVSISTWNDHMQRVTWALGTPLTQRWLREEEREMLDRVAMSWGFQERWRRGEEQGAEWEALREEIGMRGMQLDRVDMMDDME